MKRKLAYLLICSLLCILLFPTTAYAHEHMPRIFIQVDDEFLLKDMDSSMFCNSKPAAANEHGSDEINKNAQRKDKVHKKYILDKQIKNFICDSFLRNIRHGQQIFQFHDHIKLRRTSLK